MKTAPRRPIVLVFALLLAAATLCACIGVTLTSCAAKKYILLPSGDGYFCKANGVTYLMVQDLRFEAVTVGEQYGELQDGHRTIPMYRVEGLEPTDWLVTDSGTLYRSDRISLPDAKDFAFSSVAICRTAALTIPIAAVTDKATVEAIRDAIFGGETPDLAVVDRAESYRLKLENENLHGICFSVNLLYYENGLTAYDNLTAEQAKAVDEAIARAEADLTEEEKNAGVTVLPTLPDNYTPLTKDERVGISMKRYSYTASDGSEVSGWTVLYDYGKYFLSDRETGKKIPVFDLLKEYIEEVSPSESESNTAAESDTSESGTAAENQSQP